MDYAQEELKVEREKMKPVFLWLPAIFTGIIVLLTFILKLAERTPDGFASWGVVVIFMWLGAALVTFGLSVGFYALTSVRSVKPGERNFHRREDCDTALRKELRRRTNYNLDDFSETSDSVEGDGWFGEGKQAEQDKLYFHLYRIQKGAKKRYLLAMMNMEEGKEDDVIITQSPMNFQNFQQLIEDTGNRLCRNPVRLRTRETVYHDEVSGRSRTEKEQSPLDQPEIDDAQAQGGGGQQ